MTSASTSTARLETTSTTRPAEPDPSRLITVDGGNLVALDLATGRGIVLAGHHELAASLGLAEGRFEGVDLSPDGSVVAFAFGGWEGDHGAHGLYEVPADGSSSPRRVRLDAGEGYVGRPHYSPDGRQLAVYSGDRLQVLDEERTTTGEGVQMAYPPHHLTWSPGGDALVWLGHYGRNQCCTLESVSVDPATGRMTEEPTAEPTDGSPFFDPVGQLRTMPPWFTFDVDVSGRFVVASDGTPRLLWWDVTADEPLPRPLPLDIDLPDAPPIAW